MVLSMTGFGHVVEITDHWSVKVEAKAVNHRYLDINIRLPYLYQALEEPLRQLIKSKINRGHVDIYLNIEDLRQKERIVKINKGILTGIIAQWRELQMEFALPDLSFDHLLQIPGIITVEDEDIDLTDITNVVLKATATALDQLNAMRAVEGAKLTRDIEQKLENLEQLVTQVREYAPQVVSNYRKRLQEKLTELLAGTSLDAERIETEVAIFADRCSIDEEIVRLSSHIQHFHQSLHQDGPIGRKLDFLIQEMNREVNTIGSKANDLHIAKHVVELKNELERIREQIQNLE